MKRYVLAVILLALASASMPSRAAGFDNDYTATTGDLNGDGLLDIYLKPKAGLVMIPLDDLLVPIPLPPDVSRFVLQQLPDQTFQIVTNFTAAQRSAIAQWPAAAIVLEAIDINLDGILDLVVSGIPNTDPVIVFANPQDRTPPLTATSVNAPLKTFASDVHRWIINPARIVEVEETGWYALHELMLLGFLIGGAPIIGDLFNPNDSPDACTGFSCQYDPTYGWIIYATLHYNVLQYQQQITSQDAFDLTQAFDPTLQDTSIIAQSPDAIIVADMLERLFGVEVMRGVLRNGGARDHESPADPNLEESRWFDILTMLAALAAATTDISACRPLTAGEKVNLALGNQLYIKNIDRVRVCNGGFLGIQGYLMAPNGHIYVGTAAGVPWRADYSAEPDINNRSLIVHEMFHVYQNRNRGCRASNGCMLVLRVISLGNYCYTPLAPGKSFWEHNLEQEAELVADRYRLRGGHDPHRQCNQANAATLPQLEQLLPPFFY